MNLLRDALNAVVSGRGLDVDEASRLFGEILDGEQPVGLVAGLLVALAIKGESAEELAAAAAAMLKRARPLDLGAGPLLDTAGTGGDGIHSFNVSTGAALVAAAAGIAVAKHGNRAASGRVGGADVLEHVGVRIDLDPAGLKRCLRAAGICFVFARSYHPVLARLAELRRELGIRTIFNMLGPLANPAGTRRKLVGVADVRLTPPMAQAIASLGAEHAMVVHAEDGLDELSTAAPTRAIEVRQGTVLPMVTITPEQFGIRRTATAVIRVENVAHAAQMLRGALAGEPGAPGDVLALNAGAAIYVGGGAGSLAAGVERAREILASGAALDTLEALRQASVEESPLP